jgi:murein DD-endopeptidase MepM/ murein hydrolase activator NlpD
VGDRSRPDAAERGSVGLLALLGGALVLLIALVPLVVVTDLVVTRARAQTAADAAALAAMAAAVGDGRGAARALARANGGRLLSCCGDRGDRREVTVAVGPSSRLLVAVVPWIEARAAAGLVVPPSVAAPPSVGADAASIGPGVPAGGRVGPLSAPLTSGFGTRVHPITGEVRLHTGLDLGAPSGTPVAAAAAGVVAFAGPMGGYGNAIDVRHADGTTTRYAHLSVILVRGGQRVAAGQGIGLVGSTGLSTGPHLHFEVRTAAGPVDPHTWLPQ